jgi:hypothetical protein
MARGVWLPVVYEAVDKKGAQLASKITTLECLGLLLPLMAVPTTLASQHVSLGMDNIGVVFGWQNDGCKGDAWASLLICLLHVAASYLGCTLYLQHMPRLSTAAATIADSLTWSVTTDIWAVTTGAATFGPPHSGRHVRAAMFRPPRSGRHIGAAAAIVGVAGQPQHRLASWF